MKHFRPAFSLMTSAVALTLSAGPISAQVARDYISIVGSSTVYPFSTVVAEQFGKTSQFKTPKVESTGSGGGIKLFCGGVGVQYPDIVNSSRAIKPTELAMCATNGVKDVGINPAVTKTDRMITQARVNAKLKFGDEERWAETITGLPFNRPIESAEIADLAVFLASPRGVYVNGTVVDVDGGGMWRA